MNNNKIDPSFWINQHLDNTIDELLRKYNIVVYNSAPPFVDPTSQNHAIMFGYTVKKCFPGTSNGWNHRIIIGRTGWYDSIYTAKREAIIIAANYLINEQKCKHRYDII